MLCVRLNCKVYFIHLHEKTNVFESYILLLHVKPYSYVYFKWWSFPCWSASCVSCISSLIISSWYFSHGVWDTEWTSCSFWLSFPVLGYETIKLEILVHALSLAWTTSHRNSVCCVWISVLRFIRSIHISIAMTILFYFWIVIHMKELYSPPMLFQRRKCFIANGTR